MVDSRFDNPFHDLWITEAIGPNDFVEIFSPLIVHDAEAIFSAGNIVVKGRQGSGKSMLLSLLATPTRIAFELAKRETPIPKHKQRFLSCGVNCIRDQVSVIGLRAREVPQEQREAYVAAAFADLLNCLLCMDFLRSIRKIWNAQTSCSTVLDSVVPAFDESLIRGGISELLKTASWSRWIDQSCNSIDALIESLERRERAYRDYANFNVSEFSERYLAGRTALGEPLSVLADTFRRKGIVDQSALVFAQIDQAEELFELDASAGATLYRGVVASALARRDSRVAYRIGVRRYAFVGYIPIFGSSAPLEEKRDYTVVDIDDILARRENSKSWAFPRFAEDVIARRVRKLGYEAPSSGSLKRLFGSRLSHAEKANLYSRNMRVHSLFEPSWHPEWKSFLSDLWDCGEKFEAFLGACWLRQRAQISARVAECAPDIHGQLWDKSKWWRKERNEAALAQLAGRNQQALIWCGNDEILGLSGHNILALMVICQATWEAWQRRAGPASNAASLPEFSYVDQTLGVTNASAIAFRKVAVGVAAESRRKFISSLGTWLAKRLMDDSSLSNPGHTGISISEEEFVGNPSSSLVKTIKACADYGDLLEGTHTTKNKDRSPRLKWYMNPLLCPYFRIPHIRTKEPVYTDLVKLAKQLHQEDTNPIADSGRPLQADLFSMEK